MLSNQENKVEEVNSKGEENNTPKTPKSSKSKPKHRHHKKEKSDSNSSSDKEKTKETPQGNNKALINDFIAENFVLLNLAGKGAFGEIYLSYSLRDSVEVAVKKEKKRYQKSSQLKTEGKIYTTLLGIPQGEDITGMKGLVQQDIQGVPKFYGVGELVNEYYLIIEFLGPNLIELFNFCKTKKLSIPCVCLIAIQMLNRIENLHKNNFIHRDIKPENFVIGTEEKSNVIYLIDFGLSKRYKNPKNHQHIPYREGRPLTGTARYVSINTHLGIEQSRRDDLESIGYVLIFFLKGSLPWKGLKVAGDKYIRIMEKKLQIPTEILCYGLPDEMVAYLNYCKSLRFEDRPDYDYLRGLFITMLTNVSSTYGLTRDSLKFDWCYEDPATSVWGMFKTKETTVSARKNNESFCNTMNMNKMLDQSSDGKSSTNINSNPNTNFTNIINNNKKITRELTKIDETPQGANDSVIAKKESTTNGVSKDNQNNSMVFQKTNENNPNISIESSAFSESKSKRSKKVVNSKNESAKEDNTSKRTISSKSSSEETIKIDFQGQSYIDKIKTNLTDEEIKNITSYFNTEDIDSYITKILNKASKTNVVVSSKNVNNVSGNSDSKIPTVKDNSNDDNTHNDDNSEEESSDNKENKPDHSPIIGAKDNKKELKDSIEINKSIISIKENDKSNAPTISKVSKTGSPSLASRRHYYNQKMKTIQTQINTKNNFNLLNTEKNNDSNSDSDSSGIAEKNPTLLSNTMKNSRIGLSENENKKLEDIVNKKKQKEKYSTMIVSGTNAKTMTENVLKMSKRNVLDQKEDNKPKKNPSPEKSFENEIIPKISAPGQQERRKSRILEMNLLDNMKFSKENFITIKKEPLVKYYSVIGDLGSGSYGTVKKVRNIKLKEIRAMKIVSKKSESSHNEIEILRKISHPNIVNIYEIFEDSKKFYIMYELIEGGELFEAITSKGFFREKDACVVMRQILKAVNYLHNMNIVHRDLKPENIMLVSKSKFEVKIIDFGTAKILEKGTKLSKFIGTSYYIAPEVIKENYDEKCDVWSCGVILYILLCGYPPFNGSNNSAIYYNIQNSNPDFTGDEWKDVTKEAIELIKQMLVKDPSKRISASVALSHKWFRDFDFGDIMNNNTNIKNNPNKEDKQLKAINKMASFVIENKLKQAVLQFISSQFDIKKEEENLREIFRQFDTEKKGLITKEIFLKQLNSLYGENDAAVITERIFSKLDLDGSGEISYNEFLTAMIDDKKIVTIDRLDKAFKLFDKDGNGKLSIEEIKQTFGGDDQAWKKVIQEVDKNNDGEVDFEEFKTLMLGLESKKFFDASK